LHRYLAPGAILDVGARPDLPYPAQDLFYALYRKNGAAPRV
jgi:hypothetical protein